jgi:hypothetical protein
MAKNKIVAAEAKVEPTKLGGDLDLATAVSEQTGPIKAAIEAGDVIARIKLVKRNDFTKDYLQLVPKNLVGALALSGGIETSFKLDEDGEPDFDGPSLVKDFFYGNDLGAKSRESQKLAVLVEGPDKAKQAAAKNLAKAYNITEEAALAKIEQMGL